MEYEKFLLCRHNGCDEYHFYRNLFCPEFHGSFKRGENNDRFDRGPAFPILPELVTS